VPIGDYSSSARYSHSFRGLAATEISKRKGITKAEAMRRAFALLAVADKEEQKPGGFSLGIVRETADHGLEAVGRVIGV
jgi:hypothetical protein